MIAVITTATMIPPAFDLRAFEQAFRQFEKRDPLDVDAFVIFQSDDEWV